MRFLANENFPGDAVSALQARGHDVVWVRTSAPGSSDIEVLNYAQREDRILITFDKDFGELAFRSGLPSSSGIILFRIATRSAAYVAKVAIAALESRSNWAGAFSVINDDRIRMTPLPSKR
jgi:predicted nuclease of predicted toxin-antitoxin system